MDGGGGGRKEREKGRQKYRERRRKIREGRKKVKKESFSAGRSHRGQRGYTL